MLKDEISKKIESIEKREEITKNQQEVHQKIIVKDIEEV